ncbi:glycosyltransferase [Nesterenkonia jeotgali]|uniref:Glycosyltransferase involved in cell wall biosynthesis n=1 Tax=Nesterenkonia jeotgali TaxID=317018 RepID=A0A839FH32_9MICC|nr:glycosyltransferase [Nesterenkonia jeotgali]MBA8921010.1 glycosyltransferase involved in cell wall biosynthesis [Nesterenkonia jeotgali]
MNDKPINEIPHEPKTIVIVGTRGYPSYYGGFETAVRKLAPYLTNSGWEVVVYGRDGTSRPNDPDIDPRVTSVVTRGLETKSLSTLSYGFFSALDAWKRKPDVAIVMNCANGFILPLLKLRGIPTLVNVDGMEWERAKWGRTAKFVFKLGARFCAWFGTQLVFDAHEIARRWQTEFKREGVVIPYGGDFREELPLEEDLESRSYVLYVARFVPENSIREFLDAVQELAQDTDVVIVGSSGYGGTFDELACELADRYPRVRWLGHVDDDNRLHALWQHAGVYFHGHSVGGTNPALVQAMALGAPVVARDTVFNREVLGEAAVFVMPEARLIVDALRSTLRDRKTAEIMATAGTKRARANYTWPRVNRQYEESSRELVRLRLQGMNW